MRVPRSLVLAALSSVFLSMPFLLGCAGTVGPEVRQDITGQIAENSPLNKATFTQRPSVPGPGEYEDTSTFDTVGTIRETSIETVDGDTLTIRGGNEVRTDQVIVLGGDTRITNLSGKDVSIGGLTGKKSPDGSFEFSLTGLTTLASAPIRASNEALDRYQAVYAKLSEEQRRVIESANAAWVEAVKAVPEVVEPFKALLGVPP